ncbi:adenylyl cyclase [Tieghemostelium lacteum]|uniref:Adenylyl cyclase n=1 Tax=Tieghemostelium lacteum TaxID=361077 RepID=A0A151ZEW3_TIELA|nr:adenylyl cyclase [Tieghemostelium lacteum]|eukprot:KYQ92450.1 adenylyl cyclase [Tieghemostelium lacteum]
MLCTTWTFLLNGVPMKVHINKHKILVNDVEVPYMKNTKLRRLEFNIENNVLFITNGPWYFCNMKRILYVNGVDIVDGSFYIEPTPIHPGVYVLIIVLAFVIGFLGGLAIVLPFLIYLIVIACIFRKKEYHLSTIPLGDPNFAANYHSESTPIIGIAQEPTRIVYPVQSAPITQSPVLVQPQAQQPIQLQANQKVQQQVLYPPVYPQQQQQPQQGQQFLPQTIFHNNQQYVLVQQQPPQQPQPFQPLQPQQQTQQPTSVSSKGDDFQL